MTGGPAPTARGRTESGSVGCGPAAAGPADPSPAAASPTEDSAGPSPAAPREAGRATTVSRRGLLGAFGIGLGGLAVGATTGYARGADSTSADPASASATGPGGARAAGLDGPAAAGLSVEPCYGAHQAGIATRAQAHARFLALDLRPGVDRGALVRLMRVLTEDIARLTSGRPALADPTPELAALPARLTVTVGFGLGLLTAAGRTAEAPGWLASGLPSFSVDRLRPRWSGGDLLLQVAADDPVTVAHAVRVLLGDARTFATLRWVQSGFLRSVGSAPAGMTGRNLFGQVDGTVNPTPGTDDFDRVVWIPPGPSTPEWLEGGTALVVRRIAMDLETWGSLGRDAKEQAVGRRLSDGAPLTGGTELTGADFAETDADGFPVIADTAHIRLAHAHRPVERILRRPYSYDDGIRPDGSADAGQVFVACMADPVAQFVPLQQRLAEADVLNVWTTPIGSALFAVPPGVTEGQHLGQGLLGA